VADVAELYASRVSCSATPNSDFGYVLEDVPFSDCSAAFASKMPGTTIVDFPCEGFAPVVGTGGKQVLWGFNAKVQTPAGETFEMAVDQKYTFGDDGKIVALEQNWDTAPFDDANVASVKKLCTIQQELTGKATSQRELAKVGADIAEYYAATIDCSSVASNTRYGLALTSVPLAECMSKLGANWEGYEITKLGCDDVASVAGSEGRKLIWSSTTQFMTPGGKRVSGHFVSTYVFNDAGKIVSVDSTFDTGMFGDADEATRAVTLTAEKPQMQAFSVIAFAMGCVAGPAVMLGAIRGRWQQPPSLLEGYQECNA